MIDNLKRHAEFVTRCKIGNIWEDGLTLNKTKFHTVWCLISDIFKELCLDTNGILSNIQSPSKISAQSALYTIMCCIPQSFMPWPLFKNLLKLHPVFTAASTEAL
jgi:hypothetical protein